jgi:signal peptidase I
MYEQIKEEKSPFEVISGVFAALTSIIFNTIEAIVIALALSIVLYLFIATPHEVIGSSMLPNFQNGEYLIANKLVYRFSEPKRGDVIIFKYDATQDFIKRVIGLPGDLVSIRDGRIYINNKQLDESAYLESTVYTNGGNFLHEGETLTVPADSYFVCGDNRPHSSDSRDFGPIKKEQIKGRAWIVYFPFSDFKIVNHPELSFK